MARACVRVCGWIAMMMAGGAGVAGAQAAKPEDADVLRAILIPSLEYTDLQGVRKLAAKDVGLVDVRENLASPAVPSMREQMWKSYEDARAKHQSEIDSLRTNLKNTQWCRYGTCHPSPNNQLIRDALASRHLSVDDVVALDVSHTGQVWVYYQTHG
jgi:hypothetical protein